MAAGESLEVVVARLDERSAAIAEDVAQIQLKMATRTDQENVDRRIGELLESIAEERANRKAAVDAEHTARNRAISEEKRERQDGDKHNRDATKEVAVRLQAVEDRMEARKYSTAISFILAGFGAVLSLTTAVILMNLAGRIG